MQLAIKLELLTLKPNYMKTRKRKINYLITGLFLFGVILLLWNCTLEDNVIETDEIDLTNVKTVSFKDAIAHFNTKNEKTKLKRTYAKGTKEPLEVTPDWNTLEFNDIAYTDANLTTANAEINRDGKYSSQLYFINVNNHIRNVIFTIYKDEEDANGNIINGRIYFNDLNGKFLDGYIIKNGVFTKRYIIQKRNQTQKASFLPLFLFQTESDDIDYSCWVYSDGELDEVVVTAYLQDSDESGGGGSGNGGGVYYTYGNSYGSYINGATSNGFSTNLGSPNSLSSGQITSAAAAILMVASIEPDEMGNCPDGYVKNPTTGKCESICTGSKIYNEATEECECPEGTIEDENGNCVQDNDCQRIKRLVQNDGLGSNILPTVNELRTKLGAGNNEWSITYINKWMDGIRKNVPDENGIIEGPSPKRSYFTSGNTFVGQIHTHPEGTVSIFSWLDVRALKLLHTESHEHFNNDVFLMVVAPNNLTYTLKVDNIQTLIDKIKADIDNAEGIDDDEKFRNIMLALEEDYSESTNLEQTFLDLYGSYGISLYKTTDANLNNWEKLELDENETISKNPCN